MLVRLFLHATILVALTLSCTIISSCGNKDDELHLADLTQKEYTFVERMVILERAKAVALADKETGGTLLDSLAIAWGDSALVRTHEMAGNSPLRSAAVADLLGRILEAEQDSLVRAPHPDRLGSPLSDP